jgi:nicotinate phosphoribosyltransferase
MGKFELQVLYARAMTHVWEKIQRLKVLDPLRIADFGTRRRHSFLWQDWCVQAMQEGLGKSFLGTSNCLIAQRREVEAIGTNAHELPMVYSAMAKDDAALAHAPYAVLEDWQKDYQSNLLIALPDTYGTDGFLDRAPDWLNRWTGIRVDSGDPIERGEAIIDWWTRRGEDPKDKLMIFSDGLDVDVIETLLVCKVVSAEGTPTVKLSDNPRKAMGPAEQIERYKRVFEVGAQAEMAVEV